MKTTDEVKGREIARREIARRKFRTSDWDIARHTTVTVNNDTVVGLGLRVPCDKQYASYRVVPWYTHIVIVRKIKARVARFDAISYSRVQFLRTVSQYRRAYMQMLRRPTMKITKRVTSNSAQRSTSPAPAGCRCEVFSMGQRMKSHWFRAVMFVGRRGSTMCASKYILLSFYCPLCFVC